MSQDRKAMTSSALRKRRQAVKKLRAELKRELREIEAEIENRKLIRSDVPLRFVQYSDGTYTVEPAPPGRRPC